MDGWMVFLLKAGGVYLRSLLSTLLIEIGDRLNKYRTDFTDFGIMKWCTIN
jgi:hypothetical protein